MELVSQDIYLNQYLNITDLMNTDYYHDLYRPLKVHYSIASVLVRDNSYESCCAINRGPDDEPYTSEDLKLFGLITPHLSRAIHIFKELTLFKHYSSLSKSVLDQDDKAVIVCDEDGKVIVANEFSKEYLTREAPITLFNDRLELKEPINNKRLHSYISECANLSYSGISNQRTILLESSNVSHSLVTVSPLKPEAMFNDFSVPCALVTVNRHY